MNRFFVFTVLFIEIILSTSVIIPQTVIKTGQNKWIVKDGNSYTHGNDLLRVSGYITLGRSYITWNNIRNNIPTGAIIDKVEFNITWSASNNYDIEYYDFDNYTGNPVYDWDYIDDGTHWGTEPRTTTTYNFAGLTNKVQEIVDGFGSNVIRIGIKIKNEGSVNYTFTYSYNVDLYITYTGVTVDQLDKNNISFGQVGQWINNNWTNKNVPFSFLSTPGSNLGLRSLQEFKDGTYEKYQEWTANSDKIVINPYNFVIQSGSNLLTAKFQQSYNNVIINNSLEGSQINLGKIHFKDPWLIDYLSQFPNTNSNRGMSAPFKERLSPFNPNFSTNYNGDVYKGILLNQSGPGSNWQGTYYSVKSEVQDIYLSQTGNTHSFYFHNWSGTGVGFQYPNSFQTGVVFTSGGAEAIANLKGTQLSNQTDAYNSNSQRKAVRLENSNHLFSIYKSLNNTLWLEQSSNNGSSWYLKNSGSFDSDPFNEYSSPAIDYIPQLGGSHPFAAIIHNFLKLTIVRDNFGGTYYSHSLENNWVTYGPDYISPAVAATSSRILVLCNEGVNQNNQIGIAYYYGTMSLNGSSFNITWTDGHLSPLYKIIPGTNSTSRNISVVADKNTSNVFHITWNQSNALLYCKATGSGNNLTFSSIETVSASSGWSHNLNPSISLANGNPVISWTGSGTQIEQKIMAKEDAVVNSRVIVRRKGTTWGDFQIVGNNVNYTNNNSVTAASEKTVIVWSEGTTPQTKWMRRTSGSYNTPANLSHSGIQTQIISGYDYNNMTSLVFSTSQTPYYFTKSTTNFSGLDQRLIAKIEDLSDTVITFGRAGIVNINGVEFIFNTGDIIVDNSIIEFIDKPDTLVYTTDEELNQYTRSNTFELNSSSGFYFSNLYYVNNKEAASSLTENDNVNFKIELVKAVNDQVVGTFDNIDFHLNSLDKYSNVFYQVDCSGIETGEYYIRLVTTVNSEVPEYALANIMTETSDLDKKYFTKVGFTGNEQPITYELFQNYPNPFNPITTIRYQVPEDGVVSLKIYDILGKEVTTLVNENKAIGKYDISFDASNFASGVYIYRIQVNNFVSSKKMMLLK